MIQNATSAIINAVNQLVIERGYVVIPSWGTFFCHPVPAQWDKHSNTYLPPHYKILFNKNIQKSDGVLELSLTNQLNCTYYEALQVLSNEIGKWQSHLLQFGKLQFGELGDFLWQKEQMLFQSPSVNFDSPDYFGLNPLKLDIADDENRLIFSYPASKVTYNWVKTLVILPIIIALALLPSKINKYTSSQTQTASVLKHISLSNITNNPASIERTIDTITSVRVALQMPEKTDSKKTETIKNTEKSIPTVKTEPEKDISNKSEQPVNEINSTSQKQFYVIVASFMDKSRVKIFNRELSKMNIEGNMLNCNGKLRVSIGGFSSKNEAQKALDTFKHQHPSYSGWILFW